MRARRPGLDVRTAWIELAEPGVPAGLADVPAGRRAVLVPLLLSSGYHDRVDLPASIAAARPGTAHAAVLGPDPLLATALADRLAEAGRRPGDAVVLAAAGSSDPDAVASVHTQAALLVAELTTRDAAATGRDGAAPPVETGSDETGPVETGPVETGPVETGPVETGPVETGPVETGPGGPVRVTVGFGSAAEPDVRTAVAAARDGGARVAVAPYLLAPGFFADRLAEVGADLVAAPLGDHPAVVELVLRRADAASTQG